MDPHPKPAPSPSPEGRRPFGIYVHYPYCAFRCPYCDFAVSTDPALQGRYTQGVLAELRARAPGFAGLDCRSLFLGGGTPSLWDPAEVERVVLALAWLREGELTRLYDRSTMYGPRMQRDMFGNFFYYDDNNGMMPMQRQNNELRPIGSADMLEVAPGEKWLARLEPSLAASRCGAVRPCRSARSGHQRVHRSRRAAAWEPALPRGWWHYPPQAIHL